MTFGTIPPQHLILACIAMVERELRGNTQGPEVNVEVGGATDSIRMLSSLLLTSVLLLSVGGEGNHTFSYNIHVHVHTIR